VPPAPGTPFRLTILHNNDGESQLINLGSALENYGGVARFAAVVQREKRAALSGDVFIEDSGVITVSSGDNFLAGPEFTVGLRADIFYDALALDLIDYDAIALGNHDFDFGPEVLANFIKQVSESQAPFLSSNLDFTGEPVLQDPFNKGRIAESVVVGEDGERIGIIGATTPSLRFISSPRNVKIIGDVAGEVQDEVNRLQADGVNKIDCLTETDRRCGRGGGWRWR
jgi:5'-nucleotidase